MTVAQKIAIRRSVAARKAAAIIEQQRLEKVARDAVTRRRVFMARARRAKAA